MTRLERTYRRLLLAYPRAWREARGEELLGVLLLAAEAAHRGRPSVAETANLIATGLRERAAAAVRPLTQQLRDRVALLALASGAALAVVSLVRAELPPAGPEPLPPWPLMPHLGPFLATAVVLYAAWLVALGTAVLGGDAADRTGRTALALATGGVLASNVAARTGSGKAEGLPVAPLHLVLLLAFLAALALLGRPGRAAGRRAPALLAVPGVAALLLLDLAGPRIAGWENPTDEGMYRRWFWYRGWGHGLQLLSQGSWVLIVAALLVAALVSTRRRGWFAATAVTCTPWVWFGLLFLDRGNTPDVRGPVVLMVAGGLVTGSGMLVYQAGARSVRTAGTSRSDGSAGSGSDAG